MKILIENLTFHTIIGALDKERKDRQKVVIDAEIEYDYKKNYLDYAKIVLFIKKHINRNRFFLIEDALLSTIENLKKLYPEIKSIKISIKKPQILPDCTVGVEFFKKF